MLARLKRTLRRLTPGPTRFGRSVSPQSRKFGLDRGSAIDRNFIESFLQANCGDIRKRVLEIGDATYTRKFGSHAVTKSEVLHAQESEIATIVGDLTVPGTLQPDSLDCAILTQTLPFIFDFKAAIRQVYDALSPGGVVLATLPGISQISRYDMDRWGDYWRFTTKSAEVVFGEVFGKTNVQVASFGNVFNCCAFLYGMTVEELTDDELSFVDQDYQLLITVRAIKGSDKAC